MMRFSNTSLVSILVAAAIALSGCAGSAPQVNDPRPSSPTVGPDLGAIQGLVTNEELEPIRNAQVALQSGELDPVTTDVDGRFQFSEVAPGKHVVFVTSLGYESAAKAVDVVAGEIREVSVRLQLISPTEPFSVMEIKEGYIACGTGTGAEGVAGFTQVQCGDTDPNQRFLFNYTFAKGLKGLLLEMAWKPTQALSKDLLLIAEKEGCGFTCTEEDTFAELQGCCAIRIALKVEDMAKGAGDLGATDFTDRAGTIQTRTFPAFGEGGNPTTVFTSQEFEIYAEYFYHELPADWDVRSNLPVG